MDKKIIEIGILVRGFSVCSVEFQEMDISTEKNMRMMVFQGIVTFANALTGSNTSFFSMKKQTIYFTKKPIQGKHFPDGNEDIMCYLITKSYKKRKSLGNKEEKALEKNKSVFEKILDDFLERYKDEPLVEEEKYKEFQEVIRDYAEKISL